jgi:hypothetical protein
MSWHADSIERPDSNGPSSRMQGKHRAQALAASSETANMSMILVVCDGEGGKRNAIHDVRDDVQIRSIEITLGRVESLF